MEIRNKAKDALSTMKRETKEYLKSQDIKGWKKIAEVLNMFNKYSQKNLNYQNKR